MGSLSGKRGSFRRGWPALLLLSASAVLTVILACGGAAVPDRAGPAGVLSTGAPALNSPLDRETTREASKLEATAMQTGNG